MVVYVVFERGVLVFSWGCVMCGWLLVVDEWKEEVTSGTEGPQRRERAFKRRKGRCVPSERDDSWSFIHK